MRGVGTDGIALWGTAAGRRGHLGDLAAEAQPATSGALPGHRLRDRPREDLASALPPPSLAGRARHLVLYGPAPAPFPSLFHAPPVAADGSGIIDGGDPAAVLYACPVGDPVWQLHTGIGQSIDDELGVQRLEPAAKLGESVGVGVWLRIGLAFIVLALAHGLAASPGLSWIEHVVEPDRVRNEVAAWRAIVPVPVEATRALAECGYCAPARVLVQDVRVSPRAGVADRSLDVRARYDLAESARGPAVCSCVGVSPAIASSCPSGAMLVVILACLLLETLHPRLRFHCETLVCRADGLLHRMEHLGLHVLKCPFQPALPLLCRRLLNVLHQRLHAFLEAIFVDGHIRVIEEVLCA
mmetsp:Transcript_131903/g.367735  ORF Transcript_131903/g.367735 Transcript_131903/m.367735 type:complete len:355 (-) Transcript_131903:433-1497(-)